MTYVVVTRPLQDAVPLTAEIKAAGYCVLHEPLFHVAYLPPPALPDSITACAFTSANGVRAVAKIFPEAKWPSYAVGPATAMAIEQTTLPLAGTASSNVQSLAALIAARPPAGCLLHAVGRKEAGDLVAALHVRHVQAVKAVLYKTVAVQALSRSLRQCLHQQRVSWITFLSPYTATIFQDLIRKAGLTEQLTRVRAAAFSPAVANVLQAAPWQEIRCARSPTLAHMIDMLVSGRTV